MKHKLQRKSSARPKYSTYPVNYPVLSYIYTLTPLRLRLSSPSPALPNNNQSHKKIPER